MRRRFNSQPREGGWSSACSGVYSPLKVSTRSRAKAAGCATKVLAGDVQFQLAAARRRLVLKTRPAPRGSRRFNSQPREGGWFYEHSFTLPTIMFQLAAARRRLDDNRNKISFC